MYTIREVRQYSIVEYRIMRGGDGLVAYTYSDPTKAYLKLARLMFSINEEELRYLNWIKIKRRLRLTEYARYMSHVLPCF